MLQTCSLTSYSLPLVFCCGAAGWSCRGRSIGVMACPVFGSACASWAQTAPADSAKLKLTEQQRVFHFICKFAPRRDLRKDTFPASHARVAFQN